MKTSLVLKRPVITEKAARLSELRKYIFVVDTHTTKNEVREAVKTIYHVDAVDVNILRKPGRARRFKNHKGTKPGYKKAVVTLKEGQKIDLT